MAKTFEILFFKLADAHYLVRYHGGKNKGYRRIYGDLLDWKGNKLPSKDEIERIISAQCWRHTIKKRHLVSLPLTYDDENVVLTGIVIPDEQYSDDDAYEQFCNASDFKSHMPLISSVGDNRIKILKSKVDKVWLEIKELKAIEKHTKKSREKMIISYMYWCEITMELEDLIMRSKGVFIPHDSKFHGMNVMLNELLSLTRR